MSHSDNGANRELVPERVQSFPQFETYEVADGTVIFDGCNPLAWIHSNRAVPLDRMQ